MLRCHTPPQCGRAPARGAREPLRAAASVVRCARGGPPPPQASGLEASATAHATANAAAAERPVSLAERLLLGSLLEDGLSYKESFIVRCYEVGINKTATVETIANLLQVLRRHWRIFTGSDWIRAFPAARFEGRLVRFDVWI
jgi:fatty acyl-ACP thioesterase A